MTSTASVCMCVCVSMCVYVCKYVCAYVYIYVCMYLCMYVCVKYLVCSRYFSIFATQTVHENVVLHDEVRRGRVGSPDTLLQGAFA